MAIIIMQIPNPKLPHIIGFRRPYLSRKNVGNRDPMKNMALITPPSSRERFLVSPTFSCNTEVISVLCVRLRFRSRKWFISGGFVRTNTDNRQPS